MPDIAQWRDWINDGFLAAFVLFVFYIIYLIVRHGGKKALELGERYVKSTENLHDTLKEAEDNRNKLCERHATVLGKVTELVDVNRNHLQIGQTDMQRMKQAAVRACRMCKEISVKELPDSAAEVARHCDEIERVLGET